jgi:hypothetical protein
MAGENAQGIVADVRAGLEHEARHHLKGDGIVAGGKVCKAGGDESECPRLYIQAAASEPHEPMAIDLGNTSPLKS